MNSSNGVGINRQRRSTEQTTYLWSRVQEYPHGASRRTVTLWLDDEVRKYHELFPVDQDWIQEDQKRVRKWFLNHKNDRKRRPNGMADNAQSNYIRVPAHTNWFDVTFGICLIILLFDRFYCNLVSFLSRYYLP